MRFKFFFSKIFLKTRTILNRLRKISGTGIIRSLKNRFAGNTFGNISRKLLFFIIGVLLAIGITVTLVYYFSFYLKPNFEDSRFNYISTTTPDELKPGDEIIYDIYYMNNGFRNVDSLKINVSIPESTSFSSSSSDHFLEEDNSMIIFETDNTGRGSSGVISFTVIVDDPLENGTIIAPEVIQFQYTIKDEEFVRILDPPASLTVSSRPVFSDLSIETSDASGGYLNMGDELEYTIRVKNEGDMNATGFQLKARISDMVTISENSISGNGKYEDGYIIWDTGLFETGRTMTYRLSVKINEGLSDGDIVETLFQISCDQDISMRESSYDEIRAFPDFSTSETIISDSNGGNLWAGETVDIKILVKNSGQRAAENYSLICPTPDGSTYISSSGTADGIRWEDDIRGLVWELGGLAPGAEREITFRIKVNDDLYYRGGTIITDFKIESEGQEYVLESRSLKVDRYIYMTIVAMGDSLIARSDWVQRFDNLLEANYPQADYNTVGSGKNGETSSQGYYRFDSTVAIYSPQIVILVYGTNDAGSSLSNFSVHVEGLVNKAQNLGATVFINLIGPLNYPGKENWPLYNQKIIEIAAKYSLPVIDVMTPLSQNKGKYFYDGVHYTPEGSAVVAQTVFNAVAPYLNSTGARR
ncbi:MAG: GDSL-type esterase/lipase family protein [Actinobacteria bacterium]|nr:GDSL-type esterase/lipase family protein [Actinomycetota bacterium]